MNVLLDLFPIIATVVSMAQSFIGSFYCIYPVCLSFYRQIIRPTVQTNQTLYEKVIQADYQKVYETCSLAVNITPGPLKKYSHLLNVVLKGL